MSSRAGLVPALFDFQSRPRNFVLLRAPTPKKSLAPQEPAFRAEVIFLYARGVEIHMREGLVFHHIFPIDGPASAKLMQLKADCLLRAGVIDAGERDLVYARGMVVSDAWRPEPDGVAPDLLSAIVRKQAAPEPVASPL
jgi:hypothetical protein